MSSPPSPGLAQRALRAVVLVIVCALIVLFIALVFQSAAPGDRCWDGPCAVEQNLSYERDDTFP